MSAATTGPVVVVATEETAVAWTLVLRARGIDARACPASRVAAPESRDAVRDALLAAGDALVLATSPNAVRFLPDAAGRGRPAAAVGAATARALRAAGFAVEARGESGAEDLARRLVEGPARHVLWLRGEVAREEGAATLRAAGWTVDEVVAYRVVPHEGFAACVATGPARAYVLGSPRSVAALVLALRAAGRTAWLSAPLVTVGATTLEAIVAHGFPGGIAATEPTVEAVVAAVESLP